MKNLPNMSGGSCPRKDAVSANSKPAPRPQSVFWTVVEGGALAELVDEEAMGLFDAPSRLPDALGDALGDLRC